MSESEIDRCEFWVSANRRVRESGMPNCQGEKIEVNFDWDLNTLEQWLDEYHDKELINYLRYGWPLNAHNTEINTTIPKNQAGVKNFQEEVNKYLNK